MAIVARLAIAVLVATCGWQAVDAGERVNKDEDGVAIEGYDTVAYFTEGKPMRGAPEHEHVWQDSRWQFASADHLNLFIAEPEKYAPRYGGYCTDGMAVAQFWRIDPEAWTIVDGKLYLNYDKRYVDEFEENAEKRIAAADANWEQMGNTRNRARRARRLE